DRLAGEVRNLDLDPGRTLMSAESSSFHAWFYDRAPQMQETNFANSTISYYNKGALLGMLLDLEIRDRTEGAQSLDDLLRLMYRNFYQAGSSAVASVDPASTYYLPGRGYEEHDILAALNALTQSDLTSYFDRHSRRLRIPVKLSPPAADQYSIEELAQPSSKQIRIRQGWLGK